MPAKRCRAELTTGERTGLVACAVFKTVEAFARGLVGSIPTRSRQEPSAFYFWAKVG
jgi:hypothetical protein